MRRSFALRSALLISIALVLANATVVVTAAQAAESYQLIEVSSATPPQTFDNGTSVTASFSSGAVFAGTYYSGGGFGAPKLKYQVREAANSAVRLDFSSSLSGWTGVTDLKLYYGWVNPGDESVVSTNLSPGGLDFTTSGLVVSHDVYATCGDCYGIATLDSVGQIKAPNATTGRAYSGVISLHFDTPITWIQVLGPGTRTDVSGWNGFGFELPVVTNTVTFMANDGTSASTSQTAGIPTALTANAFSQSGYTFAGWATQPGGGGDTYLDGAEYSFAADVTLYAQWQPVVVSHTVSFDPNGGSGTFDPQQASGIAPLNLNSLTRDGYTFAGWNTARDGSGTTYADGADFDFSSDQTLYAQWTLIPVSPGNSGVTDLVNTGLALLGPMGTAGLLVGFGVPVFFAMDRFRRVRTVGLIVVHKSTNLTVSTPATWFDNLRKRSR